MYKIKDLQNERYFADGAEFKTKEEIRQQLVSYHANDCDEKFLDEMALEELLEFGGWEIEAEICYECGRSVARGSGRFVNRIPSFDDEETRKEMNVPYPEGGWLCAECDLKRQSVK